MKQENLDTGTQINEEQNTLHTPVTSKPSLFKEWSYKIFGLIIAFICLYAIFCSHTKNTKNDDINNEQQTPTQITPPQLPLTQSQVTHLQSALAKMNSQLPSINNQQIEAAKLLQLRMSAPISANSSDENSSNENNNESASNNTTSTTSNDTNVIGGNNTKEANSKFMADVSQNSAPTINATRIQHMNTTIAQGNIIQATLETRISSDLPGMVRAITSSDIYSEDDSTLLLPKGSKLIGQYSNGINQGQTRVFVVWQRLIRPDGIDIELNSPGTDSLGGAGLSADDIDHHFWEQFGTAGLLSIISAGAANIGVNTGDQYNSSAAYREALANSFNQTAQQTLQGTGVISPTLSINQGTKINVFVARDLDFYDELMKPANSYYSSYNDS